MATDQSVPVSSSSGEMKVREYRHTTDAERAKWGEGPWLTEPDKIHWIDEATGLDCLMHRNSGGAWCGYVGVVEGHPHFGIGYSGCSLPVKCEESFCDHAIDCAIDVHGGLTYADFCQVNPDDEDRPESGICHVAFDGRPERVWWLGFDCAHSWDVSPAYDFALDIGAGTRSYRNRAYVEGQCRHLAAQLDRVGKGLPAASDLSVAEGGR